MKPANPVHDCLMQLFEPLGKVKIRRMFGGSGVYSGEDLFALIDEDRVYVKVDDELRERLVGDGGQPFEWTNPDTGKAMTMNFVSLPDPVRKNYKEMREWGRMALSVAQNARREKVKSPRRGPF